MAKLQILIPMQKTSNLLKKNPKNPILFTFLRSASPSQRLILQRNIFPRDNIFWLDISDLFEHPQHAPLPCWRQFNKNRQVVKGVLLTLNQMVLVNLPREPFPHLTWVNDMHMDSQIFSLIENMQTLLESAVFFIVNLIKNQRPGFVRFISIDLPQNAVKLTNAIFVSDESNSFGLEFFPGNRKFSVSKVELFARRS
jgi:hypothetical protein